ncbi:MAG: hypothetical protein ACC682_05480 [Gemmatimonadota bacterium]
MKARSSVFVLGTALVIVAACGGGAPGGATGAPPTADPTPQPPPVHPPPPAAPPPSQRVEPPIGSAANFDIIDDSFVDENGDNDQEGSAEVQEGRMVSWTQNGKNIHRVEFSQVPFGAEMMDSRDLKPGATWQFRPSVPGKYVFFCRYHEYMMDVVITVTEG